MFTIDCPGHGHRVMVPERRIRALRNTSGGILLELECWCGTRVTLATGRRRAHPAFGAR
jgi:hypothetical protein